MKLTLAFALIASLAATGPVSSEPMPLYTVSGTFQILGGGAGTSLELLDQRGGEIARYDLSGCEFSADRHETGSGDGVFALLFPSATEPMVAVVCHLAEGGQRFALYAPARDPNQAIFEVTGDRFVRYVVHPVKLVLSRDTGGRIVQEVWRPGMTVDAGELNWIQELIASAAGRRLSMPESPSDPDVRALAARLAEIVASRDSEALVTMAASDILISFGGNGGVDELREILDEPWFWPEFENVLEGGGALAEGEGNGRAAIFPALSHYWPEDLDAYGHVYGERPGARLRAGPSDQAPVIAELHGRFVARGPYLETYVQLIDDNWVHICTEAEGCGFARANEMRSPIGRRAIFGQSKKGAPWVLEIYVAGD